MSQRGNIAIDLCAVIVVIIVVVGLLIVFGGPS